MGAHQRHSYKKHSFKQPSRKRAPYERPLRCERQDHSLRRQSVGRFIGISASREITASRSTSPSLRASHNQSQDSAFRRQSIHRFTEIPYDQDMARSGSASPYVRARDSARSTIIRPSSQEISVLESALLANRATPATIREPRRESIARSAYVEPYDHEIAATEYSSPVREDAVLTGRKLLRSTSIKLSPQEIFPFVTPSTPDQGQNSIARPTFVKPSTTQEQGRPSIARPTFVKPANPEVAREVASPLSSAVQATETHQLESVQPVQDGQPVRTCCELRQEILQRVERKRKKGATDKEIAYMLFHLQYESSPYADYGNSGKGHPYLTCDAAMKATINIRMSYSRCRIGLATRDKVDNEAMCKYLDDAIESVLSDLEKALGKIYHDHSLVTNAALRMEIIKLTEKIAELVQTNQVLSKKVHHLKDFSVSEDRCRALESALAGLRSEHDALERNHKQLQEEHREIEYQFDGLESYAESMEQKYATLEKDSERHQKTMKGDVAALRAQLQKYEPKGFHKRFK